jgi:4-hydroxybenzoate polyprenyltransferase
MSSPHPQTRQTEHGPPLYVDLDETLCRTDLLWEALFVLLKTQPFRVLLLPFWLLRGKAHFKTQLAQHVNLNPALLPYHEELLEFLREEARGGRRLVLATAAPGPWAARVAEHLGVFSGVLATSADRNLSGDRKLAAITSDCRDEQFDYAANAACDLAIWGKAREAILVNASAIVQARARSRGNVGRTFAGPKSRAMSYVKAMRAHQWLKNLLIFVPLLTAHAWYSAAAWYYTILGFVAFSLVASSLYILNDLLDLGMDRAHPRKRLRPFAAGDLPLSHGVWLFALLLATGLASGALVSWLFCAVLLAYAAITSAYSFHLKTYTLIDVLLLAALYTVRVIAGAVAISVPPSFWLLAFSMFTFFSLALLKRFTELLALKELNVAATRGRDYSLTDLALLANMGAASGYVAVLVLALFINSPDVATRYTHPYALWLLCPLFLYWISRLWLKAGRGEMHDDPVVYAVKDRGSRYVVLGMVLSLLSAL